MKLLTILIIILLLLGNSLLLSFTKSSPEAVKVTYKISHHQIKPGDTLLIEFAFSIPKGWHIYWTNPGDAGLPTIIEPLNTSIGKQLDVLMPIPKALKEEDLTFYCYENKVKMVARYIIDSISTFGNKKLDYELSWLMCKNECYPGSTKFSIPITISSNSIIAHKFNINHYPIFQEITDYKIQHMEEKIVISLHKFENELISFFPLNTGYFVYNNIQVKKEKDKFEIILPLDKFRESDPEKIEGLFVLNTKKHSKGTKKGFYSTISLTK